MSKSCIGAKRSTITADPHRALSDMFERLSMPATPTNVAMMQALTTDGDSPVIKAYTHSNTRVIIPRMWRMEVYRKGYNSSHRMRAIMPVCKPLTARMCEMPATEKYCRVVGGGWLYIPIAGPIIIRCSHPIDCTVAMWQCTVVAFSSRDIVELLELCVAIAARHRRRDIVDIIFPCEP